MVFVVTYERLLFVVYAFLFLWKKPFMKDNRSPDLGSIQQEAVFFDPPQPVKSIEETVSQHYIAGVPPLVDVRLVVNGKAVRYYKYFELKQSTQTHHSFAVSLCCDALQGAETYQMEEVQKLLGTRLVASLRYKNLPDQTVRHFVGVITAVHFEQAQGSRGDIVLKGYSPTFLLDQAPHIQSFGGDRPVSLYTLVQQVLDQGYHQQGYYQSEISPSKVCDFSYMCQYNETSYNFLARMAAVAGESFFYDGETLHFGKIPLKSKPIPLVYGRDVSQVDIRLQVRQVNRTFYGYNSLTHEKLSATTSDSVELKGSLAKSSYHQSSMTFAVPSLQGVPWNASTHQDIEQIQQSAKGSTGMEVFVVKGSTVFPFLYPGCLIELNMLQPNARTSSYFTTLIITDIQHTVDALGQYSGTFEAVDAQMKYLPSLSYDAPVANPQLATVMNNTDPQGKGRVQVQFDWQHTDQRTAFIRVMTPNAGSSTTVDTNRGMVFIPEVGDQVLVGFVEDRPDCPFVLGSLFHGKNGAGGGVENEVKSLKTRSGHTLKFTDDQKIELYDVAGNHLTLDTKAKNMLLTAPESIVLSAKNIQLQASENITAWAKQDIHIEAEKDMVITAGNDYNLAARNAHSAIVYRTIYTTKAYFLSSESGRIETTMENLQLASSKEVETISNKKVKLL